MGIKFGMEMSNIIETFEDDGHLINYLWLLKTRPLGLILDLDS